MLRASIGKPLSGARVAFAAFEPFPSHKGSGTRMRALMSGLRDAGAEVSLISLAAKPEAAKTEEPLLSHIDCRAVRVRESNYLARALRFRRATLSELVAVQPDLVYVRGIFEGSAALAYQKLQRVPVMADINGLPSVELRYHYPTFDTSLEAKFRREEHALLERAAMVTTQSQTTADFLARRGLPLATPCHVIPNAADPAGFAPGKEVAGRLVYVGTLAPWQGVVELMMALRRIRRERDVTLEIVGPAKRSWRKQLERIERRLKIRDAVRYHGALSSEATAALIASAAVCVAPLRSDLRNSEQGCSPIKLFEYMSAAKATLSTDLPCVREIIEHARTGWLVPRATPRHLADALERLLADDAMRSRLGATAREKICTDNTWAHRQRQWVKVVASSLGRHDATLRAQQALV